MELVKTKMPRFRLHMHLNCQDGGRFLYRDDEIGLQMEVFIPKKKNGTWGKQKTTYFIDGDDRKFTDKVEFMKAVEGMMRGL